MKLEFGILHERAFWVGVYATKERRIRHCIFLPTDNIPSHFLLTLGAYIIFRFFRFG